LIFQPPATNQVTSDESSTEGNAAYSIANKRLAPSDNVQVADLNAPLSFEPIPLSVPQSSGLPTMELYPVVNQPVMSQHMTNLGQSNRLNMFTYMTSGFGQFTPSSVRRQADQVLDEAVDELFSDDPLMNEAQSLDGLWDTTAFGEEGVQDDLQLGYMLEKILDA
jgi:hypothetical protein